MATHAFPTKTSQTDVHNQPKAVTATLAAQRAWRGTPRAGRRACGAACADTARWPTSKSPSPAQRRASPGGTCRAPCESARRTSGGRRMTTHRLLRSSNSSRRTGTTVGSTSGHMLGRSGSTPVCGVSTVVNTTCRRSRLRASSAAPEYLAQRVRRRAWANTAATRTQGTASDSRRRAGAWPRPASLRRQARMADAATRQACQPAQRVQTCESQARAPVSKRGRRS